MKIDITKKYRYRMGDPVQILAVNLDGPMNGGKPQPVAAYDAKAHEVTFHHADGRFDCCEQNDALDLIEVREPREWKATVALEGAPMPAGTLTHYDPEDDEARHYEVIRVREIID
jgi:hypothetical protein